jgi:Domain of unknown function (DUF4345)
LSERRALQVAVVLAALVPVVAGASGALMAPGVLDLAASPEGETHVAYLNGLLLGVGLAFWSLVPSIERQGRIFGLLTACVFLGGLARLLTAARLGVWSGAVSLPLVMELAVTPALWLWQRRVAGAFLSRPE